MKLRRNPRHRTATLFAAMLVAALSVGPALHAQMLGSSSKTTVTWNVSPREIPAGSTFEIQLKVEVAAGWHINSHSSPNENLIVTTFELEKNKGFELIGVSYPKGKTIKFDFSDEPLDVYQGTIIIVCTAKAKGTHPPGVDTLHSTLTVQACNDRMCLAPSGIVIPVAVHIIDSVATSTSQQPTPPKPTETPAVTSESPLPTPAETVKGETQNAIVDLFDQKGSLVAYLAIFLIGLALNLTPCVYPMMTITVSLFGTHKEANPAKVFFNALIYVLGIATMYTALGVSAALSGSLFGSWLQSPWVLGGIGVLLIGLALSSFGLYQIQMPYWLTSRLGGTTGAGMVGLFLSGLVVGVFAAPCTGPPVIALLAFVGAKGDPVLGFWVFFTLSIGLGLPYLVLGTFSGLLKKIPRSGIWLVWVERIFGVVLIGAGLFYLSLALFPKASPAIVPLTLTVGGIYLGFVEKSGKGATVLQRAKWSFGILAIAFGIYIGQGLMKKTMTWEHFTEARFEEAKSSGKPVLIDFYADWCIPCLELDRKTFVDPKVIEAADQFVRLKVDLTRFDSKESGELRKKFSVAGVPTIVFIRKTGEEVANVRVVEFVPAEDFVGRLKVASE